jgi:hypothetical protein
VRQLRVIPSIIDFALSPYAGYKAGQYLKTLLEI